MEIDAYVYVEGDFPDRDSYQKLKLLDFVNRRGYLEGVVPPAETDKKHLMCLLNISV